MPTPIFLCGAECAIAAVGTTSPAVEHWSFITGAPTVVTSGPATMRSTRCYRFNPSAATMRLTHTFAAAIASPATMVARAYIYFTTLPSANVALIGDSSGYGAWFDIADNTIRGSLNGVTFAASGFAPATGTWYRLDIKVVHNTTSTVDLQVDGAAQAQASAADAAAAISALQLGDPTNASTADYYIDDIIVSGTSADYPIGEGTVYGLYPSGDGTHSYSATTDFAKEGTAQTAVAAAGSETTTWLSLRSKADGGLSTTVDNSNFVSNLTGGTGEYLRWNFEDLPTGYGSVNGVASVSTHHAATATANAQSMKIIDVSAAPVPEITVLGTFSGSPANTAATGVDLSETTIVVVYKCAATGETTGAWTVANVNDLGVHWSATDVAPDAYINGICLEVDVKAKTLRTVTPINPPVLQAVRRSSVF